jgi:sugar-specific transcriptional regulator TrmB
MKQIVENYKRAKDLILMIPKVVQESLKQFLDNEISYLLMKRIIANVRDDLELFKSVPEIENDEGFKEFVAIVNALFKMEKEIEEVEEKINDLINDIKIIHDVITSYQEEQKQKDEEK